MSRSQDHHDRSSELCDELFQALKQKIRNLQRTKDEHGCVFFTKEKKHFVFTRHRKEVKRVEVHFLSQAGDPPQSRNLVIKTNAESVGGPEIGLNYSFDIESIAQVKEAARLLYKVAYRLSQTTEEQ